MTDQAQPPHPEPRGGLVGRGWPAPYGMARYAALTAPGVDGPWGPLADWGSRVAASLIDSLVALSGLLLCVAGVVTFSAGVARTESVFDPATQTTSQVDTGLMVLGGVLALLGLVAVLAIQLWNRTFRQGRTGQSLGKTALGLRLVEERTGQPVGAGMAFVRELCHTLDGLGANIGYLWPLWDDKRQTFADKVIGTVVVRVPRPGEAAGAEGPDDGGR